MNSPYLQVNNNNQHHNQLSKNTPQPFSSYCYSFLLIIAILILITSWILISIFSNSILLSQPRDSNGNICSQIGNSPNSIQSKKFPFLFLKVNKNTSSIQKYCVSMCPTSDRQFNQQNIEIYKPQKVFKNRHHMNTLFYSNNHLKNQQNEGQSKYNKDQIDHLLLREHSKLDHKSDHEMNNHALQMSNKIEHNQFIQWLSIQQTAVQSLGGVCISQKKLEQISSINREFRMQIMRHEISIKYFGYGILIIVIFILCSIFYQLLTKVNLFNLNGNSQLSIHQQRQQQSIMQHNSHQSHINQQISYIQNRYKWSVSYLNFILVINLTILLVLLIIALLIHQFIMISKQYNTSDYSFFINFLKQINHYFSNSNHQNSLTQQKLIIIFLLIAAILILFYLLYNMIFRYRQVIPYSIFYIQQGSKNINKFKFTIYSIIAILLKTVLLCLTIFFITISFTLFKDSIDINKNQIYAKVNYCHPKIILTILFQFILFLYLSKTIDQFYLYLVTFQSTQKFLKSSPQSIPKILTMRDINYITKNSFLITTFIIPIKICQIFNIKYSILPRQTLSEQASISLKFRRLINLFHQLNLNQYSFYCMCQKFQLARVVNYQGRSSHNAINQQQVAGSVTQSLYNQSYANNTQKPSFYVYRLCQNLMKVFLSFMIGIIIEKQLIIPRLSFHTKNQNANQLIVYSIPLIVSVIILLVSKFPLQYVFINAETIQLSRILWNQNKSHHVHNQR